MASIFKVYNMVSNGTIKKITDITTITATIILVTATASNAIAERRQFEPYESEYPESETNGIPIPIYSSYFDEGDITSFDYMSKNPRYHRVMKGGKHKRTLDAFLSPEEKCRFKLLNAPLYYAERRCEYYKDRLEADNKLGMIWWPSTYTPKSCEEDEACRFQCELSINSAIIAWPKTANKKNLKWSGNTTNVMLHEKIHEFPYIWGNLRTYQYSIANITPNKRDTECKEECKELKGIEPKLWEKQKIIPTLKKIIQEKLGTNSENKNIKQIADQTPDKAQCGKVNIFGKEYNDCMAAGLLKVMKYPIIIKLLMMTFKKI